MSRLRMFSGILSVICLYVIFGSDVLFAQESSTSSGPLESYLPAIGTEVSWDMSREEVLRALAVVDRYYTRVYTDSIDITRTTYYQSPTYTITQSDGTVITLGGRMVAYYEQCRFSFVEDRLVRVSLSYGTPFLLLEKSYRNAVVDKATVLLSNLSKVLGEPDETYTDPITILAKDWKRQVRNWRDRAAPGVDVPLDLSLSVTSINDGPIAVQAVVGRSPQDLHSTIASEFVYLYDEEASEKGRSPKDYMNHGIQADIPGVIWTHPLELYGSVKYRLGPMAFGIGVGTALAEPLTSNGYFWGPEYSWSTPGSTFPLDIWATDKKGLNVEAIIEATVPLGQNPIHPVPNKLVFGVVYSYPLLAMRLLPGASFDQDLNEETYAMRIDVLTHIIRFFAGVDVFIGHGLYTRFGISGKYLLDIAAPGDAHTFTDYTPDDNVLSFGLSVGAGFSRDFVNYRKLLADN